MPKIRARRVLRTGDKERYCAFRCSADLHARLTAAAAARGHKISGAVREAIEQWLRQDRALGHRSAWVEETHIEALQQLAYQLSKAGANLNQMLRSVHLFARGYSVSAPLRADYERVLSDLQASEAAIRTQLAALGWR